MSLLSYNALINLLDQNILENSRQENVNAASIDLVLGRDIQIERAPHPGESTIIDMLEKGDLHREKITMDDAGYIVKPGQCVLAHTVEIFHLPEWLSGQYLLKSTQARNFMQHLNAGWADAGWNGSVLTLEFVNHNQYHSIRIKPGQKAGQMIFFKHEEVPADRSYAARGQYNGHKTVMAGQGLR